MPIIVRIIQVPLFKLKFTFALERSNSKPLNSPASPVLPGVATMTSPSLSSNCSAIFRASRLQPRISVFASKASPSNHFVFVFSWHNDSAEGLNPKIPGHLKSGLAGTGNGFRDRRSDIRDRWGPELARCRRVSSPRCFQRTGLHRCHALRLSHRRTFG